MMQSWLERMSDALPLERLERRQAPPTAGLGASLGLVGIGLGAGLMYFFDPELGARRRAQLRTRLESLARRTSDAVDDASREVVSRARGFTTPREAGSPEEGRPS